MREANGGKAIAIQADATDADVSKAAVEKTVATFGPGQLRQVPTPTEDKAKEALARQRRPKLVVADLSVPIGRKRVL